VEISIRYLNSTVLIYGKLNNAIPTVADSITAGAKPTLTTSQLATSTTLTGWTTSVSPDDVFFKCRFEC
jgi:hypothetical protein